MNSKKTRLTTQNPIFERHRIVLYGAIAAQAWVAKLAAALLIGALADLLPALRGARASPMPSPL